MQVVYGKINIAVAYSVVDLRHKQESTDAWRCHDASVDLVYNG